MEREKLDEEVCGALSALADSKRAQEMARYMKTEQLFKIYFG